MSGFGGNLALPGFHELSCSSFESCSVILYIMYICQSTDFVVCNIGKFQIGELIENNDHIGCFLFVE